MEALTPLRFLERASSSFGDRTAVVDGEKHLTYAELHQRCLRLAGALRDRGIDAGDRVAVISPNSLPLLEAHDGVPRAGGVLVAINARLNAQEIAAILDHSEPRLVVIHDRVADTAARAIARTRLAPQELHAGGGSDTYEAALEVASPWSRFPTSDSELLSINYTSGTTGLPKGVMYSHRGAFLQALAMSYHARLGPDSTFLWTLPMFHCNGWCFPWAVTGSGGRHIVIERPEPEATWRLIAEEDVTHFNCAPTVLGDLVGSPAARRPQARRLRVAVGGSPPSPTLLSRADAFGIDVTHLYGLTETYGPAVICDWQPEWDALPPLERARLKSRQGIANIVTASVRVLGPDDTDVSADGKSVGEIAIKGDNVMLGYYRDEEATAKAIPDGWFRSGDLGVRHPDGYIELTDRAKDIIISGGENIASVEVERVIASHPDVLDVAVVAAPHARWGEVPVAYIALRPGSTTSDEDISAFLRERIAHFKVPKRYVRAPIQRTSTGKVQKHVLRADASARWPADAWSISAFTGSGEAADS